MTGKIKKLVLAANSKGIDGQSSALEPDSDHANRLVNYEQAVGNSFRGRAGCQTTGAHGFFAIFPYRYTRTQDQYDILYRAAAGVYPNQTPTLDSTKTTADGASIERIIALNRQAWVLDTMNIVITYVSGTYPFTWYSYVNGSNINFNIKANAVSILDTSLGNGIGSTTSIYDLLGTVDALAQLSVSRATRGTCPPFAIVNGNQTTVAGATTTYGIRHTVTVDAGHNFSSGDIITFPITPLTAGFVIATTATTIVYVGRQVTLVDNDVLGYMGQPATNFPISTANTASSGNLTFSFPYWRLISEGDADYGNLFASARSNWEDRDTGSFYAPAVAENASGNLYIAASGRPVDGVNTWANNLIKIDGQTCTRAGLPTPITYSGGAGGAGALTGEYRYKSFLRRYDAQGNIIDGPVGNLFNVSAGGTYTQVAITPGLVTPGTAVYASARGFFVRSAFKNTTEAPASGAFFSVDDNSGAPGLDAFLQVGDPICLTDTTAQTTGVWHFAFGVDPVGTLHRTVCTGYDRGTSNPSSIRVADSSGYSIPTNSEISAGLTVVVLRTTAGGNQYYVLCEMPVTGYGDVTFFDNCTDATLTTKEQFIEPEIGKEHDPPPACTLVCQHNGGLVVARGPTSPNTVTVSTADGIEYFPVASNGFDVPSTQPGSITAIASDTNDRLAVFKERGYYDVVGDVDQGTFSVNIRNEGDYGITSQASIVRLPIGLVGLSRNGWVVVSDGLLDPFRFQEVNARIVNQAYQFAWATAVNDSYNRNYLCTIPQVSGEPVGYSIDYSRPLFKVFERSYTTQIDQAGGAVMIGDTLYHLSQTSPYCVFRRLTRFSGNSPSGNGDGDTFIDNTNAISHIWETPPYHFDAPAQAKSVIRGRVWSIPNDYVAEGWVAFAVLVETGASCFEQYIGDAFPGGTETTISFTSGIAAKDFKVTRQGSQFYMLRFTTNTIRTSPFITGFAILAAENYINEDFINK